MHPFALTLMALSLLLGTCLTISSSHWLSAWLGLEISTLAILPLMACPHHPRAIEAAAKYFLVQASAGGTLLFAGLTNAWLTGSWAIHHLSHPLPASVVILALALKLGLAPTHMWLPDVLQGLPLHTAVILSTWQKLAPFTLLVQAAPAAPTTLLVALGLCSIIVGGWGGLNQTQLRKILAYSSTAHLGWIALVVPLSPLLASLALFTYVPLTLNTFLCLTPSNATNLNKLATSWTKNPVLNALIPFTLLSLAGLPPLSGFMSKWLILNELTQQGLLVPAVTAAFGSLLSLYFYLRVCHSAISTSPPTISVTHAPWRFHLTGFTLVAFLIPISVGMLPILPPVLAFLA